MKLLEVWTQYQDLLCLVSSSAESDFRWLVEGTLGVSFNPAIYSSTELSPEEIQKVIAVIERRVRGEPVAYILGSWDFYGRSFFVGPGVLVPRPETESIVDICKEIYSTTAELRLADFGSGSGVLALTLLLEFPRACAVAIEKSKKAAEFIKKNQSLHKINPENLEIHCCAVEDFAESSPEAAWDLVVANPPYIAIDDSRVEPSVRKFEPFEALFSERSGLSHIESWTHIAAQKMKKQGIFISEFGQGQQAEVVSFVTSTKKFSKVETRKDLFGEPRFVVAQK